MIALRLVSLAALAAGALAGATAIDPVGDSDLYWHLATARETAAHGFVRADVFSWTARGAAVPTDQWLGDLIIYAGYGAAGWLGVLAIRTFAAALLVGAIVFAALVRRTARPAAAIAVAMPAVVLSRGLWTERPELLGTVCFAVLVLLLQLPGELALIATVPLLLIWANLHGSFALGAVLVLAVAGYGMARERAAWRGHAIAAIGALASFVATPAGFGTFATPGVHLLSPPREILEWTPPDPATVSGSIWAIVLLGVFAIAALSGGARARDVILIVPLAALSLVAIRHTPLFAIAATPFLAEHLPMVIRAAARSRRGAPVVPRREAVPAERPSASRSRRADLRRGGTPVLGGSAAAALIPAIAGIAILVAGLVIAPREPAEGGFPVDALAVLPTGSGLYNQYDWGGWLIWRAPATPVFVDGRLGPYRGAVLRDYVDVLEARPGWRDVVDRRGIRWILMRPTDPVAVRAADLGWPVLARGTGWVLISVVHRSP